MNEVLPKTLPHYNKVLQLGDPNLEMLLEGPIIVEEKVDGSQLRFGWMNNKFMLGSHRKDYDDLVPPDKMFRKASDYLESLGWEKFPKDTVLYGEYLQKPRHNTNMYERVPTNNIMLFDGYSLDENRWLTLGEIREIADLLEIDEPFVMWEGEGKEFTLEMAEALNKRISYLGGATIEGIVIKNYAQAGGDRFHQGPHFACGKYVRDSFKEENKSNWAGQRDIVSQIVARFKTTARWEKALNHASENGSLVNNMKDMKLLLDELERDLLEECESSIKEMLWQHYQRDIIKGVRSGMPEWYKQRLLEEQFEDV